MSDALFDALNKLVPAPDNDGDWRAVLEAARATTLSEPQLKRRWRLSRRQAIAFALALALIAALLATPAFGLRQLILDLVGRTTVSFKTSQTAPPAVKKFFLDLGIGAPPGMAPTPLPNQAREVTFRGAGGQERVLWIAPERSGGFCDILVGAGGGCISKASEQRAGPVTIDGSFSEKRGQPPIVREVSGHVFSPKVTTLTLEFVDHTSLPLPFVYISSPINAGFYFYGIPATHQQKGHWPSEVVARDTHGVVIATKQFHTPFLHRRLLLPPQRFHPQPPQKLPTASTVNPTAPFQQAAASGFSVVAGANGAVRLTAHAVPAAIVKLLHGRVEVSCFRLTREFGIFTVRGYGTEGVFTDSISLQLRGVGRPLDGCEIDSPRGHRWPDALGSHAEVELAFTAKGRSYFADRAAAQDLALFVRSRRMQQIRKEPGAQLLHDMHATYGRALARSPIRYQLTANGITFRETSTTGRRFQVVVTGGRIRHSNLEPYAKVF